MKDVPLPTDLLWCLDDNEGIAGGFDHVGEEERRGGRGEVRGRRGGRGEDRGSGREGKRRSRKRSLLLDPQ